MSAEPLSAETVAAAPISMKARQEPLMRKYAEDPDEAWITDSATTSSDHISADQPIHTQVTFGISMPASQRIGIHRKVGGNCDFPNPGEMLSAALASCLDTATRIIANRLGIPLKRLQVTVNAKVDARGTLRVDESVPVGFQSIDVRVCIEAAKGVTQQQVGMLLKAAEHSCVVLQTLRNAPQISVHCDCTT